MADGEVSARDRRAERVDSDSFACNIAGQVAIADLLRVQSVTPTRSWLGRLFGRSPLSPRGRLAYRVAVGEVEVGDALDGLGAGWHVLHSVAVGSDAADIDHLVIGPAGIFIVTTAVHPGGVVEAAQRSFLVSDVRYPHIRNMEYEMGRVERLLSVASGRAVEVAAILAVVDPKSLTVREAHRDVAVLPSATIAAWLSGRPAVLAPEDVAAFTRIASLPGTWQATTVDISETRALRAGFDALHREVTRAWNLQRVWLTATTVAGGGAFIFVTYAILAVAVGSTGN